MSNNEIIEDLLRHAGQQTAAWDKLRLGRFTASEVYKLMGEPRSKADKEANKFSQTAESYIVDKAMETLTGMAASEHFGRAIDHGLEWEEHALGILETTLNLSLQPFQDGLHVPMMKKPNMALYKGYGGASADAIVIIDEKNVGVEIKCPFSTSNHFYHSTVVDAATLKDVNPQYYWQVMMGMLCYEFPYWIFASYDPRLEPGEQLVWAIIQRDEIEIQLLQDKLSRAVIRRDEIVTAYRNRAIGASINNRNQSNFNEHA